MCTKCLKTKLMSPHSSPNKASTLTLPNKQTLMLVSFSELMKLLLNFIVVLEL